MPLWPVESAFEHRSYIHHTSVNDLEMPLIPMTAQHQVVIDVMRARKLAAAAQQVAAASYEAADVLLEAVWFNVDIEAP